MLPRGSSPCVEEVKLGEEALAYVFRIDCLTKEEGTVFVPVPNEWGIHVGVARHGRGYHTPMHYHARPPQGQRVGSEALIVLRGSVAVLLEQNGRTVEVVVREGEGIVMRAPHEVTYLEDSVLLEIKEGPYPGPEKDKVFTRGH